MENGTNTQNGRKKKSIGSEDTDDIQPKCKKRQSETDDVGKKKNIGSEVMDDIQPKCKKRQSETDDVGKKKNIGSEDMDDMQSRRKKRKLETDDVGKKKNIGSEDNCSIPDVREESLTQMMLMKNPKILKMTKRKNNLKTPEEKESQQKLMMERI